MGIQGASIRSREPFYSSSEKAITDQSNNLESNEGTYTILEKSELPRGADRVETMNGDVRDVEAPILPHSQFSPYNLVRIKDVGGNNYPLRDEDSANRRDLYQNVTARELINNPRGASIYQPEDFLYCSKYGIIPNNRMITMRRFAYPVFDDIFSDFQTEPDIGRLVGFSDQVTNQFSQVMSMSFGLRWKELKSAIEQASMLGPENGISGWARNALQYIDPSFGRQALDQRVRLGYDPLHDQNRTYGPVDIIDSAFIRDNGLNFTQNITLNFEYKIKSINGINQKAAMLDLLANVFLATTNDAKFWGGARYWVGPRPTKYLNNLKFLSPRNYQDFITGATKEFKSTLSSITGPDGAGNALNTVKNIAENAINLKLGRLLDKIGRPGIPIMNSLLTGTPTGEWHVTIGNPMNPVLSMGDLILESTQIQFGDELGYDDFPTTLRVKCVLRHNKPKGRAEIESMFNAGRGRIYLKPSDISTIHSSGVANVEQNKNISTLSGNISGLYNNSAIQRNAEKVWSFLKLDS